MRRTRLRTGWKRSCEKAGERYDDRGIDAEENKEEENDRIIYPIGGKCAEEKRIRKVCANRALSNHAYFYHR